MGGGGGGGGGLGGTLKGAVVGGALGGTTGSMIGGYAGNIGVDKFGKQVFGSDTDAGILGTGQFKGQGQAIDEQAFKNNEALKQRQAEFQRQLAAVQNRNVGQINTAPQDQFRSAQLGLMSQLQNQAAGQGPSLADMQLRQGADRNLAQAIAMRAGGQGGGLAMRNIAQQRADIGQQLASQAGMQRLQEQQQAQAALGQLAGGARGQDIGLAEAQSNVALQNQAANDRMAQFYNTGLADLDMAQRQSLQDLEKLKVNQNLGVQGLNANAYEGASKRRGDFIGGIGQGMAAAFSDKRLKTNIKQDEKELDEFLSGLNGHFEGGVIGKNLKTDSRFDEEDETEKKAKELMTGKGSEKDSGQTKSGKALGYGVGSAFSEKKSDSTGKTVAAGVDYDAKSAPIGMFANQGGVCPPKYADGGMIKREDKVANSMKLAFKTPEEKEKEEDQDDKRNDPLGFRKKFGLPAMSEGGMTSYKDGGHVDGRALVSGDSPKNDTVLAKLSPGEGVIKRTDMQELGIKNDDQLQSFVDGLKAYTYNYKNAGHGAGKYASPMAQDLEKSELGKSMVIDTPEGKMVDYSRAAGTMLATAAMLNDKMKKLEQKVGYAEGGVVDDPLSKSMRLAFNAVEPPRKEPNSRPDYHVTESDKKFAESMRKAFRGK